MLAKNSIPQSAPTLTHLQPLNIFISQSYIVWVSFLPFPKTKTKQRGGQPKGGQEEEEKVRQGLPVHHFNYTVSSHAPTHSGYFKRSPVSFKNILVMSEAWICCPLVPPCSSGLFSSPCCVFLLFSLWLRCVNHSLPAIGWRVCVKKVAREALSQQISLRAEPTSAPTQPPLLLKIKIARAALATSTVYVSQRGPPAF